MKPAKLWLVIGSMVAGFGLIDATIPVIPHFARAGGNEILFFLLYSVAVGTIIGQVSLLAAWAALGPQRMLSRIVGTMILLAFILFVLRVGSVLASQVDPSSNRQPWFDAQLTLYSGMMVFVGWLALFVALLSIQHYYGWRIQNALTISFKTESEETQFHMGHLMLWIGAIAGVLALGRMIFPHNGWNEIYLDPPAVLLMGGAALLSLIISVPCVWAGLSDKNEAGEMMGFIFVYGMIITLLEFVVFVMAMVAIGPLPAAFMIWSFFFILFLNVGHISSLLGCLLVLRSYGYRLEMNN